MPTDHQPTAGNPRTRQRLRLWLGLAVFIVYLIVISGRHLDGFRMAREGGEPFYNDYTSQYAGALLASSETAASVYDARRRYAYELVAARAAYAGIELSERQQRAVGFSRWMHPPIFILYILPLALLAYIPSLLAWLVISALPYLAAIRCIIGDRSAWALALAAPPVYFNLGFGQTGFLTGGLIGLGLALVVRSPIAAGICIGLASFKPHFGVLIPLALALGGFWRVFGSATITVLLLVAGSAILLGDDAWFGFIGTLPLMVEGFSIDAYTWHSMTSVLSLFMAAGASTLAWPAQWLATTLAVICVVLAWRQVTPEQLGPASATLCCATVLAVPMVYLYDLVLLVPAAAWLLVDLRRHGGARWETWLIVASLGGLLAVMPLTRLTGLQIGPVLVGCLLWLAMRRRLLTDSD